LTVRKSEIRQPSQTVKNTFLFISKSPKSV
jgi:hypothetical protein